MLTGNTRDHASRRQHPASQILTVFSILFFQGLDSLAYRLFVYWVWITVEGNTTNVSCGLLTLAIYLAIWYPTDASLERGQCSGGTEPPAMQDCLTEDLSSKQDVYAPLLEFHNWGLQTPSPTWCFHMVIREKGTVDRSSVTLGRTEVSSSICFPTPRTTATLKPMVPLGRTLKPATRFIFKLLQR